MSVHTEILQLYPRSGSTHKVVRSRPDVHKIAVIIENCLSRSLLFGRRALTSGGSCNKRRYIRGGNSSKAGCIRLPIWTIALRFRYNHTYREDNHTCNSGTMPLTLNLRLFALCNRSNIRKGYSGAVSTMNKTDAVPFLRFQIIPQAW